MNKALLPAGFHDLLFPEASAQDAIITALSNCFEEHGYNKVAPPAIEYEDSLFHGAGEYLANQTFRFMDPASRKMMGVRADMTAQIARIATTRLTNEAHPLRLSYSGDVFRVQGEGLHAERQFTQSGIELLGVNTANADAQVVLVAVEALSDAGISDLCIDFTVPGLMEIILDEIKINDNDRNELVDAIIKKDASLIHKNGGKKTDLLLKLVDPSLTIEDLCSLKLPKKAAILCKRLSEVLKIILANRNDISVSLDPLESVKFSYHSTIGFSIFSRKSKGEIGRGGRYVTAGNVGGVGVTLYVHELFRIAPKPSTKELVLVSFDTPLDKIRAIRKNGKRVLLATMPYKNLQHEAVRQKCTHVLVNDDIVEV